MHGRNCIGLLAALFFLASTFLGQSADPRRDVPRVSPSSEPARSFTAEFQANNAPNSRSAVVSLPILPTFPGPVPLPIREPIPWRPPIFSPPSGLAQLARAAGIIFSGTVINVERTSPNIPGQAVGGVAITFRVQNAIRGANKGEDLTITQWIGLWSGGQRYRIGERLLLFLYPRSRIGLTSCVGAAMGRFTIDSSGSVWLSPQQILAFRTDPVLGGKSRVRLSDFASAVRWAGEEE